MLVSGAYRASRGSGRTRVKTVLMDYWCINWCPSTDHIPDILLRMILKCHFLIASQATKANIVIAQHIFLLPEAIGQVVNWTPEHKQGNGWLDISVDFTVSIQLFLCQFSNNYDRKTYIYTTKLQYFYSWKNHWDLPFRHKASLISIFVPIN